MFKRFIIFFSDLYANASIICSSSVYFPDYAKSANKGKSPLLAEKQASDRRYLSYSGLANSPVVKKGISFCTSKGLSNAFLIGESIESVEVLHIAMTNPDCTFLLFLFREILFMFHYRIKQCDIFRILCFCRISLILYWLFGILLFFHLIFFVIKTGPDTIFSGATSMIQ